MKKALIILALAALSFVSATLSGCGDKGQPFEVIVHELSLSPQAITIEVGETVHITIYNYTTNGSRLFSKWTTSNPRVANLDNGDVMGVTPGSTTITFTLGDKSASCEVTVVDPAE